MLQRRFPAGARLGPVLLLAAAGATQAAESGHREHGAHVHGHGVLEVAMDGSDLLIALRIPAVNVVGFEHAPVSDAERSAVAEAIRRFSDADALLRPTPAADCRLETAEVVLGGERGSHSEPGHDSHDHGHAGHGPGKDEYGHGEHEHARKPAAHGHGEKEHARHGDIHSELDAEYLFHCERPEALRALDLALFDHLREAREIEARVVTARGQSAVVLGPATPRLTLTP